MPNITTKDLHIFRGTRQECLAQKTEDMKIYLAWDSHEIFVGNGLGKKVKYGGSKDITALLVEEFDKYRQLLNAEIRSAINNLASDKVSEYLHEHEAAINQSIEDISNRVSTGLAQILTDFNAVADEFKNHVYEKIDEFNNHVEIISGVDLGGMADTITVLLERLQQLDNVASVDYLERRLNETKQMIDNLYYKKTVLDGFFRNVNDAISELQNTTSAHTTSINELNSRVNSLTTTVNGKANANNVYTKAEVNNLIKNNVDAVAYKTGSDIAGEYAELYRLGRLSEFKPSFCTASYSNYNIGSIYYYDPDKGDVVEGASGSGGGGSAITTIDAGIVQKVYLYNSTLVGSTPVIYEASGGDDIELPIEITSSPKRYYTKITIERTDAVSDLYVNNVLIPKTSWSANGEYTTSSTTTTPNVQNQILRSIVSATPAAGTDKIKYTASGSSIKFRVLQPTLFGNPGAYTNCGLSLTGRFTTSITPNHPVYLLTRDMITRITSSGFEVPFTLESDSPVVFDEPINGVSSGVYYYKYNLGVINDTTMTITVE